MSVSKTQGNQVLFSNSLESRSPSPARFSEYNKIKNQDLIEQQIINLQST